MAKTSVIEREKKRAKLIAKHKAKRAELKQKISSLATEPDEKEALVVELQKLPKNSCPIREQRRCRLTGRPHAVYRLFGLARTKLREAAMRGDIPGLRKASW